MKNLKINGKIFSLDDNVRKFLSDYIERLNEFVKTNKIDVELHQDILQRLSDKIEEASKNGKLSQKQAIKIVNDLGEADEIFSSDVIDAPTVKENECIKDRKPYEKWQKTKRTRPRDESILLGVCAMLGNITKINAWVGRILILLLLALNIEGFSFFLCFVYVMFAIIFPIKEKDYHHCSMLKYRLIQIWDLRLALSNIIKWFRKLIRITTTKVLPKLRIFVLKLCKSIRRIFKRAILVIWTLFLLGIIVFLGVVLYYLIGGYIVSNIDYASLFPFITKIGVAFGILSAFLLFLASLGKLIKQKLSTTSTILIAIISGVLAIIIAFISISEIKQLFGEYNQSLTRELEIQNLENDQEIQIMFTSFDKQGISNIFFNRPGFVNLHPSANNEIKVVYSFEFRNGKKENVLKAMENISEITYERQGNLLYFSFDNNRLFKDITPITPINIRIDLYMPKNLTFKLLNVGYAADRIEFPVWSQHYYHSCESIAYNKITDNFICNQEISREDKYTIASNYLKANADVEVPLKGLNENRSMSRDKENYWYLDSINIIDEENLLAKFSDKFFNFFIDIKYVVDEETAEFKILSTNIQNLEQKGPMDEERMKYYEGWGNLTQFEIQMKEDVDYENRALKQKISELEAQLNELNEQLNQNQLSENAK